MKQVKIIKKKDDYTMEYEVGDICKGNRNTFRSIFKYKSTEKRDYTKWILLKI